MKMRRAPDREVLRRMLDGVGAVREGHFIYTSGRHGKYYVNKDAIYPDATLTSYFCEILADEFVGDHVDVVLAPALGGIDLKTWVSFHLSRKCGRKVYGVYAEKNSDGTAFLLRRGYAAYVASRRVLAVEDVVNTGQSISRVLRLAESAGGIIVGAAALVNRGGIMAEMLGVPKFFSAFVMPFESWDESMCPLCQNGVPVSTDLGKA